MSEIPKTARGTVPKRDTSNYKGNKNATKHALFTAKRLMSEFGQAALDGRSAIGRALVSFRHQVEQDLGGADQLSAQEHAVLDVIIRTKLLLDGADSFVLSHPAVNKRKRQFYPIVQQRQQLAESFVRQLQVLGLKRVTKRVPSVFELIEQQASQAADAASDAKEPDHTIANSEASENTTDTTEGEASP